MKICCGCKLQKELSEYHWQGPKKGTYATRCKECCKVYKQRTYQKHKAKYIANSAKRKKQLLQEFRHYKNKPCVDCKVIYHPAAMHWHHLPQFEKINAVGTLVNLGQRDLALEEIKKCILLCANCHAIRTWSDSYEKEID